MQSSFDMKINSNKKKQDAIEAGCKIITPERIKRVPYINITDNDFANENITNTCKEVLYRSMTRNKYRYGETGMLISFENNKIYKIYDGIYGHIDVDIEYKNIVNSKSIINLAFIHNHPNDSPLSGIDIASFIKSNNLKILVSVGNTYGIHIIIKKYIDTSIKEWIRHCTNEILPDNSNRIQISKCIHDKIMSNTEKCGIIYKVYRG